MPEVSEVFIARQPIFDRKLRVVGYELLFRGEDARSNPGRARVLDPAAATATVVLNSLTEIGLDRIVGPHVAWINLPREFLLGGLASALPARATCFEVLEDQLIDDDFVEAIAELREQGYMIALDDFVYDDDVAKLVPLANVIKLDYLQHGPEGLGHQIELLKGFKGKLLAEKVETHEVHAYCSAIGFDLFQGFFYRKPELMSRRRIELNRGSVIRVIGALQNPMLEMDEIEQLVARDVPLSLRLLRYINSAFFGLSHEVASIRQALVMLGVDNVRRWATLTLVGSLEGKPSELTVTALVRARFCELSADALELDSAQLFTLGLFSLIDAMLDLPLDGILAELPFPAVMQEALLHHSGSMGELVDAVAAMEGGYFGDAKALVDEAASHYVDALMWANDASSALFSAIGH